MPITYIVEDGSGVTGANAYLTVAEADDIIAVEPSNAAWGALDEAGKQRLLLLATRYLEEKITWFGEAVFPDVYLSWPRRGVKNRNGYLLAETLIPREIKDVVARLALTFTSEDEASLSTIGIKRFRSDTLEIEFQSDYGGSVGPSWLTGALRGLGYGPDQRGGKRIIRK